MKWIARTAVVVAALCALPANAQVTGDTVLTNTGGLYGNALVAMGRWGGITTIYPLPGGPVGGTTVNHIGNEVLIVAGTDLFGVNSGVIRTLARNFPTPLKDVVVDEDNTFIVAGGTALYGVNPVASTRSTVAVGFGDARQLMWHGGSGAIWVVDGSDDTIYAHARDGSRSTIATIPGIRCLEWDRYTGNAFVGVPGALLSVTPSGQVTTLDQNKPGLFSPSDMFLRSDRTLIVTQDSTSSTVTGVYAYYGRTGRYNRPYHEETSAATGINPVGITVDHFRELAPVGTIVQVGGTHQFQANFSRFGFKSFYTAMSFSHLPGFHVGYFHIHLDYDPMFQATFNQPGILQGGVGVLSQHGTARITLKVPNLKPLAGIRLFMATLVVDPNRFGGVGEVSNPVAFTIQP